VQKKQTVKNPQEKAPKGNEKKPTQTGENDQVQQKITSFQTANGGSRADNQDPILKELTTLGIMVLEINTKIYSRLYCICSLRFSFFLYKSSFFISNSKILLSNL
jgi:hypothetical protein